MSIDYAAGPSPIYLLKNPDRDTGLEIEEILKPVEKFSCDSDSDYSDITDIFEDLHMGSYLRPYADPRKKHLSKREADRRTVENFTEDFKKTMVEVREELKVNHPLFEDEQAIEEVLNKPLVLQNHSEPSRESPINIEPQTYAASDTSSKSLVWQRLVNSCTGTFKVSPPIFDVFRQKEKHWLERPPVPWKVVDDCRIKCERWLEDIAPVGGE